MLRLARLALFLTLAASPGCSGEIKVLPPEDTSDSQETGAATGDDTGGGPETGQAPASGWSLLSLNLHCLKLDGTEFSDNDARFQAVADLVASEDVAALTAQELCDDGTTDAAELLESALEAATGDDWSHVATLAHTAWEGTADEAQESVGVFSRGEPTASGSLTYAVQGGLTRVATWATLPASLGGLTVWSVHLDVDDAAARVAQARETANAALTLSDPGADVLVAGDFNDIESSDTHAALVAAGFADGAAGLGADRIDHVFLHRGADWQMGAARLAFQGDSEPVVSDHPGVLVALAPGEGEALSWTRVTATVDAGYGHYLALRGDSLPLSWDLGWPASALDSDTWRWVSTEMSAGAAFQYKTLLDDATWQAGDNSDGTAGADNTVTPTW